MKDAEWEINNPVSTKRKMLFTLGLTAFILLPFNFINLKKFSFVSLFGILTALFLLICVCSIAPDTKDPQYIPPQLWTFNATQIMGSLGNISIAFIAHSISPYFYQSLSNKTPKKYGITTGSGYSIVFIINIIIGIVGYIRFGDGVDSNIFEAYSLKYFSKIKMIIINIARTFMAFSFCVNHSFQSRSFSIAFANMIRGLKLENICSKENKNNESNNKFNDEGTTDESSDNNDKISDKPSLNIMSKYHQLKITLAYTLMCLIPSLFIKKMTIVFKISSILISTSLLYTIPGILYLSLSLINIKNETSVLKYPFRGVFIGIFLCVFGISCTTMGFCAFFMSKK